MNIFKKKPKLYLKCNELPIHNFGEVVTNDDFSYLKKNRNDVVSDAELQQAWLGILDEFIRISKNTTAINILKKKSVLILMDKRLQVLVALKINIDLGNDVAGVCREYKVKAASIDGHIAIAKNDIASLSHGMNGTEETRSESEIDDSIAIIIKHGYPINRFTTVVSEWCSILNLIKKQSKSAA